MTTVVPAGEEFDQQFCDDFDDYDLEEEQYLDNLSSFHDDIPLIEHNSEVKQNCFIDKKKENSLFLLSDLQNAVLSGNIRTVKMLIHDRPDCCNLVLDSGWTPLAYASNFGHVDIVKALLEAEADVNMLGNDCSSAMMAACKCPRHKETLQILTKLLNKNADTHIADKNGKTVLIYAVRGGKQEVVDLLLKHCQDTINHKDKKGWTALDWAISKGFEHIALLLIKNGANVYDTKSECISSLSDDIKNTLNGLSANTPEPSDDDETSGSPGKSEKKQDSTSAFEQPLSVMQLSQRSHEEDVINIDTGIVGNSYQKYGQLELLLCGLNLGHLIEKFHEHDFHFEQLLCASNDDLIAVGIKQVGVRNRILNAVKDWNTTEWQESSLPNFSSTALTFGNLQALLRTSSEHLLYISSALRYARNQLHTYPQVMKPPANMQLQKNPDQIIITQVEDILYSTHKLCKSLKSLHEEANSIKEQDAGQYHQADFVKRQKRPSSRKGKILAISIPLFAALAICVVKYRFSR